MPRLDQLGYVLKKSVTSEKTLVEKNGYNHNHDVNKPEAKSSSEIDLSQYLREPKYSIEDVILPANVKRQFDLILGGIKNKNLIDNTWGMAKSTS